MLGWWSCMHVKYNMGWTTFAKAPPVRGCSRLSHQYGGLTIVNLNPVTQVEEVKERLTTGSEATRAMREIRTRDPNFDVNRFVQSIKVCVYGTALCVRGSPDPMHCF
jgi:hypothetical protein